MHQIHFRFCPHRWQATRSYVLTKHVVTILPRCLLLFVVIYVSLSVVFRGVKIDIMDDGRSTSYQRNRPLKCDQCLSIESDIILNNVSICNKNTHVTDIKILILIFSVNYNFLARRTIRETWLSPTYDKSLWVQHVFLLGQSTNISVEKQLHREHLEYGDIIQFSFYDAYRNLTYKTIMGYKWASIYCSNANFILKTDDDVYVNIKGLLRTVYAHQEALLKSVAGMCSLESRRDTSPSSKSYVLPQEYPFDSYPGLCNGFGYIISMQTLKRILQVYSNIPFFHLEDVYIGFCVKELGYTFLNLFGFFHTEAISHTSCNFKNEHFVLCHHVSIEDMRSIWESRCQLEIFRSRWIYIVHAHNIIKQLIVSQIMNMF